VSRAGEREGGQGILLNFQRRAPACSRLWRGAPVAILPITDIGADPETEYLSQGMPGSPQWF